MVLESPEGPHSFRSAMWNRRFQFRNAREAIQVFGPECRGTSHS